LSVNWKHKQGALYKQLQVPFSQDIANPCFSPWDLYNGRVIKIWIIVWGKMTLEELGEIMSLIKENHWTRIG